MLTSGWHDVRSSRWLTRLGRPLHEACHLVEATGATQSNVSNHLRALREAGLVTAEPAGRFTYYRLNPEPLTQLSTALAHLAAEARAALVRKRPCQ